MTTDRDVDRRRLLVQGAGLAAGVFSAAEAEAKAKRRHSGGGKHGKHPHAGHSGHVSRGGRHGHAAHPAAKGFDSVEAIPGGVRIGHDDLLIDLFVHESGAISVVKYLKESQLDTAGFFIKATAGAGVLLKDRKGQVIGLKHGEVAVHIEPKTGSLVFSRQGRVALTDVGAFGMTQSFALSAPSDLYGLGQFRDPFVNYRDKNVYLAQANTDAVNPVLVSPHGFGLLWDTGTDSHMVSEGKTLIFGNTAPLVRYHVLLGADLDAVIATYRRLTGPAPLLPKYAYGYWQSQEHYRSQDEVVGMVEGYRARGLPLDVIVQDGRYWGDDSRFSGMVWDKTHYPDPKAMCDRVHAQNAHIIASVWPAFGPASQVYKDLSAEGLLFKGAHWSGGKVLDITAPRAREIYGSHIKSGLMSVGLDGLWLEGCEPEFMSTGSRYVTAKAYADNGDCHAGPIKDHLLTFSYYQTQLIYTRAKADSPAKRPLILSRQAYAGQQAFNAVIRSGDQFAGWRTLQSQIIAAQQMSLSGLPYWTCDIGGFWVTHQFPGGLSDPAYRELYVRWFQFGAFLPIFCAHGAEVRRELWAFGGDGDPVYAALKKALNLRYALTSYIYAQAAKVTSKHETFLRPLVMDFAADPKIAAFPQQYLFGHDILVAPVHTPFDAPQTNLYEFIPNSAVTGLSGPAPEVSFYAGARFDALVEQRQSDDLKLSGPGDLPAPLHGKPYSARWTGKIIAQESGLHSFQILTQGLVKFSLDGVTRIASAGTGAGRVTNAKDGVSFGGHAGDDVYRFDMVLKAGQACRFELTQSQPKPDVVSLWVEWIRPSRKADLQVGPDKRFEVYLPAGTDWYDFHTGAALPGGQVLTLRPELATLPLYVKAGAIVPMTPGLQFAGQTPDKIELRIYAGKDGRCDLYDDEGDGHGYEHGASRTWPVLWDNAARRLTFGPAQGRYPGAAETVTFAVSLYEGDISQPPKTVTVTASPGQGRSVVL